MKESLNISLLQTDVIWEDIVANLNHVEELLQNLPESDIVVLPEMFTTAFTVSAASLAEKSDGITMQTVSKWAKDYNSLFIGSFIAEEEGKYYNRAFAVFPNGEKLFYDKKHLFIGGEERIFTAGKKPLVFSYEGWNISLAICFDLRFPTWLRNKDLKYDLLIFVAEWPANRQFAFDTLLTARAIENQSYVCACNRVGTDNNHLSYLGGSVCIDYRGRTIDKAEEGKEEIRTFTIDKLQMEKFREKFPFWKSAD